MCAAQPRPATLERVDNPDPDTEVRQRAAEVIEEHLPATAEQLNFSALAEEAGVSRQTVRNTIDSHFEVSDSGAGQPEMHGGSATEGSIGTGTKSGSGQATVNAERGGETVTITVPPGTDALSYVQGWLDAKKEQ